jgi:MFS family permease
VTISYRRYLYLTVFISGMTVLALELSASRLLGAGFGTAQVVWASVIGLTLLFLTVGYFLGGWLADRRPEPALFYRIVVWAAFIAGIIPVAARPLTLGVESLVGRGPAALVLGPAITLLALYSVPITLMGTVSPFAVRLALSNAGNAGRVAGGLYALSTVGSIIGSLLPVLVVLPALGTRLTVLAFALILFLIAALGLLMADRKAAIRLAWMPVLLIALNLVVLSPM